VLFVPGSDRAALRAALESGPDALVVDREDTVTPARKHAARALAVAFLGARRAGAPGAGSRRIPSVALALLTGAACAHHHPVPRSPAVPVPVGYEETGQASWYGHPYHGRETSSGQVYDMRQMTAAHRTLPFDTWVLVENRDNGRTVEVRINDRGPFAAGRILDLSYAAARVLGAVEPGVIPVRLRVIATAGRTEPRGALTIQVAAFADESKAIALERELAAKGVDAGVRRAELGDRVLYRVRAGHFARRADAGLYARRLAALGYTVLVTAE
jgi:rare lipoprotein A